MYVCMYNVTSFLIKKCVVDAVIPSEIVRILPGTTDYVQYVAITCDIDYIELLQDY
jgi:hypothetical protein